MDTTSTSQVLGDLSPILPIQTPIVTLSNDTSRIQSPPPLIRVNHLQKELPTPHAIRPGREAPVARHTETELEQVAREALYPYLFHLENEQREVDLVRKTHNLPHLEIKRLDEAWNILDKKIYMIHELLELMD